MKKISYKEVDTIFSKLVGNYIIPILGAMLLVAYIFSYKSFIIVDAPIWEKAFIVATSIFAIMTSVINRGLERLIGRLRKRFKK